LIDGKDGDDFLEGGSGNNSVSGGTGIETLFSVSGSDSLSKGTRGTQNKGTEMDGKNIPTVHFSNHR